MNPQIHHPDLKLDEPANSLDLEQLQYIVREKAWLIALCGLIGIFAGLAYIRHTPLTYYSGAVLEVDPQPQKAVVYADMQDTNKDPIGEEMGQTLLARFKSPTFAEEVIKDNNLLSNPDFLPPLPGGKQHSMDEAEWALIGMSRVTIRPGTRLIDVGVTHSNPVMAEQLADMIAKTYITEAMQQQEDTANVSIEYLEKEAAKAAAKLSASKNALQDYLSKTNSGSLVDGQDTVASELQNKITELNDIHNQRVKLEGEDEEIQKHVGDPEALLEIPSVATHPMIVAIRTQIDKIQSSIQVMQLKYTEKHPKMIQARTELAAQQQLLNDNLIKLPSNIHAALESATLQEQKFQQELQTQEKVTSSYGYDHIRADVLKQDVDTDQALYDGILSRLKQATVANGGESTGIHLFESALLPGEPIQARKSRTLAISLAGGIFLGLLLSMGLHLMDSSLKTVDQAEEVLGLTTLAAIPRQPQNKLKVSSRALVDAPSSPVAEAFRSLRTSLFLAGRSRGRKIVLFTSALAGEGKTFCSINYTIALAQQGLRTLLIDADLRSPMVGTVLLNERKLPGLGQVLSRKIELDAAIHSTDVENLWVMPAGELVPNPAELLARTDMAEVIRKLGEKYERIVIDTAPVTAVSDTLLLIEHAQESVLVLHAGKTARKWILRALKLIKEAGSQPAGIIMNQVPLRMAGAYSYYPGKYGEPEVYGSNGHRPDAPRPIGSGVGPEVVGAGPRF
ncbi:MAG TPA: polysaccharide biosynthesis tyrosine autokinase [Chthoniobacteraceae bacterium]|jgi:capsular exopolysaccharide synthesis family protein|nr:polysaccharide biosynthesis tyrosine autokinase [Chthoniobacteraceae bacterium]